ncbi:MAG: type I methionyl aminopeptidase [bacterium JZ-2024 1]
MSPVVVIKEDSEVAAMSEGGAILGQILATLCRAVQPGIPTMDLERLAVRLFKDYSVQPSFKGYKGYPYVLCVSLNEEVVHGFPSEDHILQTGDIVKIDCGVFHRGYHTDSAFTVCVGPPSEDVHRFLRASKSALFNGIREAVAGNFVGDIGHAIQMSLEPLGYRTMRDLFGHGIGRNLHEDPLIPNFGPPRRGIPLKKGMTLAIEVMASMRGNKLRTAPNRWTMFTADRSPTAHFEHTVLVTTRAPVILTPSPVWEENL